MLPRFSPFLHALRRPGRVLCRSSTPQDEPHIASGFRATSSGLYLRSACALRIHATAAITLLPASTFHAPRASEILLLPTSGFSLFIAVIAHIIGVVPDSHQKFSFLAIIVGWRSFSKTFSVRYFRLYSASLMISPPLTLHAPGLSAAIKAFATCELCISSSWPLYYPA